MVKLYPHVQQVVVRPCATSAIYIGGLAKMKDSASNATQASL